MNVDECGNFYVETRNSHNTIKKNNKKIKKQKNTITY